MKLIVNKTEILSGGATPPGSKSQTVRGLILATLAKGRSVLCNALDSDDTNAAIQICESLGSKISREGNDLVIESSAAPLDSDRKEINSGNSGITTRFILPVLGLRKSLEPIILDTDEQMRVRPLVPLIDALDNLGMKIESNNGKPPLKISGKLTGGKTTVNGLSSQYLSALLISCPLAEGDTEIEVANLHERPYVEMTLRWLDEQGIEYMHSQAGGSHTPSAHSLRSCGLPLKEEENSPRAVDRFYIKGGQGYRPFEKSIPGDFSSASYMIAAAVMIPGEIRLHGLDMGDQQGDKRIIEVLREMGARLHLDQVEIAPGKLGNVLVIEGDRELKGITIDCNDMPDMVPTLAVIGTYAKGKTELINVAQARVKETDRIHSMREGLERMGAKIEEREDGLIVCQSKLYGAEVHGYQDHRTIMALAIAGMVADGETTIDTAEGINKTFPKFVDIMKTLGANIIVN